MAIELNEADLVSVGKIQELKACTIEEAKSLYRRAAGKLANPDTEDRASIILANIERTHARRIEAEANPKPTRNERRLAKKEAKAAKVKTSKPKARKPKEPKDTRPETPLAVLERDVEFSEIGEDAPHVYSGNVFGEKHAIVWGERNRGVGAAARFETVNISESRLETARKYARANDMPVAVAVTVRVLGKLDQGYVVPLETFEKFSTGKNPGFTLSNAARAAYAEQGWAGCKFSVKKADKEPKAA